MRKIGFFVLLLSSLLAAAQRRYVSPIDFAVSLAGNFGEPRPNHFHCGLDVRTQGVIGKKIYSVADGYIARATVGLNGFGNALYVNHPDGNTSVYCHLERFMPELARVVFAKQLEKESETIDLRFGPGQFRVKAGQQIAVSGNTGASAGPHLHLELHRTSDGALLNPMPYFKHLVRDDIRPKIHGVRIYPMPGEGIVSGSVHPVNFSPAAGIQTFKAWGKIGFAYWADDYMNGTNNKFGIYKVSLRVDGKEIYATQMDSLMPTDHRKINSWGDYEWYMQKRNWYLKGFAEPGNDLTLLQVGADRGVLTIDEERIYQITYHLTDQFGNTTVAHFRIQGTSYEHLLQEARKAEETKRANPFYVFWDRSNVVQMPGLEMRLPAGSLFRDVLLQPTVTPVEGGLSHCYRLHNAPLPLRANACLMIAVNQNVEYPEKCYIRNKKGYMGGTYHNGWITLSVRNLNDEYAVVQDTIAPEVKQLGLQYTKQGTFLRLICRDRLSGIRSLKGYVDNKFVLFTGRETYRCDLSKHGIRPTKKQHVLVVKAEDRCGNAIQDTVRFTY